VVWGRRRLGKTRLLLEWVKATKGTYWVADQSSADIQRRYFAEQLATVLPGFADAQYVDWPALFSRLASDAELRQWRGPLVIDELPYMVAGSPEVASVLQRFVDHEFKRARLVVALSGSSQRMMQGAVLSHDAPLFGRAKELFALGPLPPSFLRQALGLTRARDVVAAFSIWGGVPRYWELAAPFGARVLEAAQELVLDPTGTLYGEPHRLLLEEGAANLRPCLDAMGGGVHRTSELAGRIGVKATSLSRPLAQLVELGLARRELPFNASERDSKRSLYKIDDPFVRMWFSVVAPRRSALAQLPKSARRQLLEVALPQLVANTWEEMCRRAIPRLTDVLQHQYLPASRYWRGSGPEWDALAWSVDNKRLLIGEAKWTKTTSATTVRSALRSLWAKGPPPIRVEGKEIQYVLFVPEKPRGELGLPPEVTLVDAKEVIEALGR